jgi:hypothetical protein
MPSSGLQEFSKNGAAMAPVAVVCKKLRLVIGMPVFFIIQKKCFGLASISSANSWIK